MIFGILSDQKKAQEVNDFNKNREIVGDADIDKICKDYLKDNLKSMALKKLGIDEEQVREANPISMDSYIFENLILATCREKEGNDGKTRSSTYNATMFLFSKEQIFYYSLTFSLLKNVKKETTVECFYNDIVSVKTESEIIALNSNKKDKDGNDVKDADGKEVKNTINIDDFVLTTSGGTQMKARVCDIGYENANSIQGMKNLLRTKKQVDIEALYRKG